MREFLPDSIPDAEVFKYSPVFWAWILSQIDPSKQEEDFFIEVCLLQSLNKCHQIPLYSTISEKLISDAVRIRDGNVFWDRKEIEALKLEEQESFLFMFF